MTDVFGVQVSVLNTAPTVLVPATKNAQTVYFKNKGAASVWVGGANVAASGGNVGFEVGTGETFPQSPIELPDETAIYGISASAPQRVDVFRVVAD